MSNIGHVAIQLPWGVEAATNMQIVRIQCQTISNPVFPSQGYQKIKQPVHKNHPQYGSDFAALSKANAC